MNRSQSFGLFLAILTLLLVFIILTHTPADTDMWWHLRTGQAMFETGRIITRDVFSYTRFDAQWINAFWLSDLLLFGAFRLGNYPGLSALAAVVGALTFGVLYFRDPARGILHSGIIVLAAIAVSPFWTPRPQIFSFLFIAILDRWLVDYRNKKAPPPWLLPIFFALWANVHGGYVWGILLLLAHLAGNVLEDLLYGPRPSSQPPAQLLAWGLASAAAIGFNPNGWVLWELPLRQLQVSLQIQEWNSPDFHQAALLPTLLLLLLFTAASQLTDKRLLPSDVLKITGFTFLALFAQRNIPPFIIVLTPILFERILSARAAWRASPSGSVRFNGTFRDDSPELPPALRGTINSVLITALLALALVRMTTQSREAEVVRALPTRAVQWLKSNQPEGRLFNSYNWGGYLLWELPEYPVFIDGRADLYGKEMIDQWHAVVSADEKALSILDTWQVHTVLLEPGWPIIQELVRRGWKIVYQDDVSVILVAVKQ